MTLLRFGHYSFDSDNVKEIKHKQLYPTSTGLWYQIVLVNGQCVNYYSLLDPEAWQQVHNWAKVSPK
jgi:hypothetical protein